MGSYKFNGPFKINNKYNGLSLEGVQEKPQYLI